HDDASLRLAVIADTHSAPHPGLFDALRIAEPDAIVHAGDIGSLEVLDRLGEVGPVYAVRGNIDVRLPNLPDEMSIDVLASEQLMLRILLLHVGVYGPKLRAEVAARARTEAATMVICGHSHVPFLGKDKGITVFNPGSAGPRRFNLPILFGMIALTKSGIGMHHVNCETGQLWLPPGTERH
ncbi:MAG TPA: metallophosphoesterase family protein, partial [Polyangiaceae bacterium]